MPLNKAFLRPPRLVSTKTLLLKHDYRRQRFGAYQSLATEMKSALFQIFLLIYAVLRVQGRKHRAETKG